MVVAQKAPPKEGIGEVTGGIEGKATITVLLGSHSKAYVEKLEELCEKRLPKFILLEESKDDKFPLVLKGEMSAKEYMADYRVYHFEEYVEERFKLLKRLHQQGVVIEQAEPEIEYEFNRKTYAFMEEFGRNSILLAISGDIERAVDAVIHQHVAEALRSREREEVRARYIAEKVRSGDFSGEIIIEAGAEHVRFKNLLSKELPGAKVTSIYTSGEAAREVFGRTEGIAPNEVYAPGSELQRLYKHGIYNADEEFKRMWDALKSGKMMEGVGDERQRLLAVRHLVTRFTARELSDTNRFEETKLANKLSYRECEEMLKHVVRMDTRTAFEFADAYVRKRDGLPIQRESAGSGFFVGGYPVVNFGKDEEGRLEYEAGPYYLTVDDAKRVVAYSLDEQNSGVVWKIDYMSDSFDFTIGDMKQNDSPLVFGFEVDRTGQLYVLIPQEYKKYFIGHVEAAHDNRLQIETLEEIMRDEKPGTGEPVEEFLNALKKVLEYKDEIRKAASMFGDIRNLRHHPEVEKLFEAGVDEFVDRMIPVQTAHLK